LAAPVSVTNTFPENFSEQGLETQQPFIPVDNLRPKLIKIENPTETIPAAPMLIS